MGVDCRYQNVRMNLEGVIKFRVELDTRLCCRESDIEDLEKWRTELRARGMVGQDTARYDSLGFGNLSKRMEDGTFLITASQTGHLEKLTAAEYARIEGFEPARNLIRSKGLKEPSSEAMTHLAIYESDPATSHVFHVHCPEIWTARNELNIPVTEPDIECGTVEMFYEVRRMLENWDDPQRTILAMGGHRDGIMSWGRTALQAGSILLFHLSLLQNRALRAA